MSTHDAAAAATAAAASTTAQTAVTAAAATNTGVPILPAINAALPIGPGGAQLAVAFTIAHAPVAAANTAPHAPPTAPAAHYRVRYFLRLGMPNSFEHALNRVNLYRIHTPGPSYIHDIFRACRDRLADYENAAFIVMMYVARWAVSFG